MLPSDRISSSRSPPPLSRPRLGRSLSQSQPSGSLSLFDGVMGGMEARGSGLQRINNTSQGPSAPSLQWNSNPLDSYGPTLSQSPPRLNYYNDPSANMHHLPSLSPGPPMMSSLGRRPSFTTGLGAAKPYSRPAPQQPALGIDPSLLFSGHQGTTPSPGSSSQFAFAPSQPGSSALADGDDNDKSYFEYSGSKSKRPKTPPDCCSVCGSRETAEWRKGPSGVRELCNGCGLVSAKRSKERASLGFVNPSTVDDIQRELAGIGAERFKLEEDSFRLPANTPARILATQERTRRQESRQQQAKEERTAKAKTKGRRPSLPKTAAVERQAAENLLGIRRLSLGGHPAPPASLPLPSQAGPVLNRGRRSNSFQARGHGQKLISPPLGGAISGAPLSPSSPWAYGTLPPLPSLSGSRALTSAPGPSSSYSFGTGGKTLPLRARSPSPRPSSQRSTLSSGSSLSLSSPPTVSKMSLGHITHRSPTPPLSNSSRWGFPSSNERSARPPTPPGLRRRFSEQ